MRRPLDPSALRVAHLEARLQEAEETLRAIRQGEVDALVVAGPKGDQVFTVQGAETPYRFLVEEMNEGALLVSPDGTVLYANARFAELTGLPLEQIIGSAWETCFVPVEQGKIKALLSKPLAGGLKAEFRLQVVDGSCRPVEVSLASLQRESVEGFSVVVADLTERKAAEQALRVSNAKLQELVADLEHFSYSISHDMRAPLRAMKSFAEIMAEQCARCENEENRDLLQRISTAASRLDALICGSLDYARVVRQELVLQPVALSTLVAGLLESYPNFAVGSADIRIEGALPVVLGNEAALTQVFSNLLDNAVKFVSPGARPQVRVRADTPSGAITAVGGSEEVPLSSARGASLSSEKAPLSAGLADSLRSGETTSRPAAPGASIVRIWVEDNGIGIPATAQARIFDLFHRANKDYEGTGIGLAIVRKTVERMGGRVGLISEGGGKGSRFWVELRSAQS